MRELLPQILLTGAISNLMWHNGKNPRSNLRQWKKSDSWRNGRFSCAASPAESTKRHFVFIGNKTLNSFHSSPQRRSSDTHRNVRQTRPFPISAMIMDVTIPKPQVFYFIMKQAFSACFWSKFNDFLIYSLDCLRLAPEGTTSPGFPDVVIICRWTETSRNP